MQCSYYQQNKCSSCQWIEYSYPTQLEIKQNEILNQLVPFKPLEVKSPFASREAAFRNKAKMAVLGTVEKPVLGIQNGNETVDLCDCPLYSHSMQSILKIVRSYIRKQGLVPYNINKRKGELKFIIINESVSADEHKYMLRFVVKSDKFVQKIRDTYKQLQEKIQNLLVVSINIQPKHAAILEGDQEIVLTHNAFLPMTLNHIPLYIKSKSFFQTNTYIAENLYKTASEWVATLQINSIWDLFCGVGGFGLSCVNNATSNVIKLTGIEINSDAIECATKTAETLNFKQLTFKSLDATQYAIAAQDIPDLVLLNPPRRGAGKDLMQYLEDVKPNYVLYSSCNLTSLTEDLMLLPNYQILKVQLFDMFPHTSHMEILVLLAKRN